MGKSSLNIALPWHSLGHGNLGVDALTRANIEIVRAAAARAGCSINIVTLCDSGEAQAIPANVQIGPRPRLKPLIVGRSEFLAALRESDLVLDIGEGDSWTDIYGNRRFAFHAGTKVAALMLGKPLVLAPQTIGPFESSITRAISNMIMNRTRAVFSRDGLSSKYLAAQHLKTETSEFIDVAFRLPFVPRSRGSKGCEVGLNVSGLLYRGGYSGRNELGLRLDYADFTHRLIDALIQRGASIYLVPHVLASDGNDDDWSLVPSLVHRFPDLKVSPRFANASEAKSFMSGLDFLVGGRMHACIAAFSAGTPVVPIAYSRKFNGLFGTLGYIHYIDAKTMDTSAALLATMSAFESRNQLALDIVPGLEVARMRLDAYELKLAEILAELL